METGSSRYCILPFTFLSTKLQNNLIFKVDFQFPVINGYTILYLITYDFFYP